GLDPLTKPSSQRSRGPAADTNAGLKPAAAAPETAIGRTLQLLPPFVLRQSSDAVGWIASTVANATRGEAKATDVAAAVPSGLGSLAGVQLRPPSLVHINGVGATSLKATAASEDEAAMPKPPTSF